jgi:peptidoglycan hydrolase-like protein with peptidoglycan-binding domain
MDAKILKVYNTFAFDSVNITGTDSNNNFKEKEEVFGKNEIKRLQKSLSELNYNVGPVDGIIGSKTLNSIRLFKKSYSLDLDDRISVDLLEQIELVEVQDKLNKLKVYEGAVDGIFKDDIFFAIQNYQSSKKLPINGNITENLIWEIRNDYKLKRDTFASNKKQSSNTKANVKLNIAAKSPSNINIDKYSGDLVLKIKKENLGGILFREIFHGTVKFRKETEGNYTGTGDYFVDLKPHSVGDPKVKLLFDYKSITTGKFYLKGKQIGPYLVFWFTKIEPAIVKYDIKTFIKTKDHASKIVAELFESGKLKWKCGDIKDAEEITQSDLSCNYIKYIPDFELGSTYKKAIRIRNGHTVEKLIVPDDKQFKLFLQFGGKLGSETTYILSGVSGSKEMPHTSLEEKDYWSLKLYVTNKRVLKGGEIKKSFDDIRKTTELLKNSDLSNPEFPSTIFEPVKLIPFDSMKAIGHGQAKIEVLSKSGNVFGEGDYSLVYTDDANSPLLKTKSKLIIIGEVKGKILFFNYYEVLKESEHFMGKSFSSDFYGDINSNNKFQYSIPLKGNSKIKTSGDSKFENKGMKTEQNEVLIWELTK